MSATLSLQQQAPVSRSLFRTAIGLDGVSLTYKSRDGEVPALQNLNLQIRTGRFVALVGPSGCGKSTLLHIMAGILRPTKGVVSHFREPLEGLAEGVGFVSQTDGLLPWKTVTENIALPLRLQGCAADRIQERVQDWLARTGLSRFAGAYPSQLSGGMRKRVALAQALVHDPKLVLMDEPLSALDVQTRMHIGNELLSLWSQLGNTMVLVTHDLEEAIGMADEVVVLSARPSRIKAVYPVNLPRPRDLAEIRLAPDFQRLHAAIWHDLRTEVLAANAQSK